MTQIRHTHPYGFRSGQWAELKGVVMYRARRCFVVEFPDGAKDLWVASDPDEPYETREEPCLSR